MSKIANIWANKKGDILNYFFTKELNVSYEEGKEKIIKALQGEGFGILTEIDVQATLKKKLNVEFYRYQILGACNPHFAYEALQVEDKIGTMLPCNVIIQQKKPNGPLEISAVDPVASMGAIENPALFKTAHTVQEMLKKVIESL